MGVAEAVNETVGQARAVVLVAGRDVAAAYRSLLAVGASAVLAGTGGLFFVDSLVVGREASFRLFISSYELLVVLLVPVVTARAFAEERRSGTDELLFTFPVSNAVLVFGKYLGAVGVALAMLATVTSVFVVVLFVVGSPDPGPILAQVLGLALLTLAACAPAVAVSITTASQALAGVVALTITLVCWYGTRFASDLGGLGGSIADATSLQVHLRSFEQGLIDAGDVCFFPAFAGIWLAVAGVLAGREHLR